MIRRISMTVDIECDELLTDKEVALLGAKEISKAFQSDGFLVDVLDKYNNNVKYVFVANREIKVEQLSLIEELQNA